ncbi:coenzyme F420-0:L-glutamate ligase [Metabacillus fastidiosus]|uniref:Coenzyme F420-0:L-glutamate ligase n=1 Tax=Metabacillus fastidiosus TaxID=1458 RepID=A0ABU6P1Y6_9BACI|nr:coenzyme F420-0:L-glutamate ligase [Metabacillus fastidiosus]MEC2075679.1 coenzyme F420-0:L-glutamate ligase [Metabacillus fastidiosus]MED4403372.1 coenzyme F420-0:L-glutamate ligase [Metabacillus fastidiosus]MED4453968.1 coenzyme F420-0:L-glutamate ligase [Metabacillus fastidiosus]MED4460726.1 coenzyme F420-0:L-glutamate ligase [Metabacillus fastidiosus]
MERVVGTVVRGLRGPIINQGDNIEEIVVNSVLKASEVEGFEINDRDIVTVTESIVARAQGNYATIDHIAKDVQSKFGEDTIGVIFPILSRNRFAICLRGIAKGAKKVVLMLSYPSDEVGNHLVDIDELDEKGVNPWTDVLTEKQFRDHFGYKKHTFTGVDYIDYYKSLVEEYGVECEVIFSNNPKTILDYTKSVLTCDIHTRFRTKRILKANGGEKIYSLDNILSESIDGSGCNEAYGLLGSNKATEDSVKLFPRNCQPIVDKIQSILKDKTGKNVEVMIYGDGAFKDPVGKIWELADPVVSPAYTSGLDGTPNEIKLKYLADNNFADLRGDELKKAISEFIDNKEADLVGSMESQGTTPRKLTDLIGSLSDLTSGSGDKGTPIIFIQGYFDNYTK